MFVMQNKIQMTLIGQCYMFGVFLFQVMRSILRKSFIMPISVLISSSSALAVYYKTRGTSLEDPYWLFSGSLMLGIIPYSASLIGPINLQFQDLNETFSDDEKCGELFTDWLTFHSPRAAVACALFSVGIYKLVYE